MITVKKQLGRSPRPRVHLPLLRAIFRSHAQTMIINAPPLCPPPPPPPPPQKNSGSAPDASTHTRTATLPHEVVFCVVIISRQAPFLPAVLVNSNSCAHKLRHSLTDSAVSRRRGCARCYVSFSFQSEAVV